MKAAILVESLTGNTWKAAENVAELLQQERWTITGLSKVRHPDHATTRRMAEHVAAHLHIVAG